MKVLTFSIVLLLAVIAKAQSGVQVVIVGFDGLGGEALRKIETTYFASLMKSGAYTLHARGVIPTVSSPNWASMIMGAGPAQHGVTSNDWQPDKYEIAPVATGPAPIFPTIFGVLNEQRPDAVMGVVHEWE